MKLIYLVIAWATHGDSGYFLDSVWTSYRKANKRCKELNDLGAEYLADEYGCGLFDVDQRIINK